MSFTKYKAFIKVVELGSITKAAAELGYSQPGVSRMLDSLEDELGITLLVRNNTSVNATDEGKLILSCCREIVSHENDLFELTNSIKGLICGQIRIGSQNSMLVNFAPKVISAYALAYPNISLFLNEMPFEDITTQLASNRIDIGFASEFKVKGLEFHPLFDDPICLIVNERHPFASYDKIPVTALNGCDFIMPEDGWDDPVKMVYSKKPFTPSVKYTVRGDTGAVSMVSENLGAYIISKMQTSLLPGNVVVKEFEENVFRTMGFGVRSLKKASPAVKEFVKITKSLIS